MPEQNMSGYELVNRIEAAIVAEHGPSCYAEKAGYFMGYLGRMLSDPEATKAFLLKTYANEPTHTHTPVVDSAADQGRP